MRFCPPSGREAWARSIAPTIRGSIVRSPSSCSRPWLAADPRSRERLRREAMAVAALDHPYICKIFEICEHGDALFLVMEYIAGETLHRRLQDGRLPLSDALRVAGEIAEALQEAHARRFLHRDLKPANIMLTKQGHVKVMDFGLAKRVEELPSPDQATREMAAQLTAHGNIVGTPDYMSPEQVKGVTARRALRPVFLRRDSRRDDRADDIRSDSHPRVRRSLRCSVNRLISALTSPRV